MKITEAPGSSFLFEFVRDHPVAARFSVAFFLADLAIQVSTNLPKAFHDITNGNPESGYQEQFTDKGKCLDQTPYDPAQGASMLQTKVKSQDILSVVPVAANSYTPSILSFVADGSEIHFADHQTGSFLVEAGCIDANSGQ